MKKTKYVFTVFIALVVMFGMCFSAFCLGKTSEDKKMTKIPVAMAADDNYLFPTIVS